MKFTIHEQYKSISPIVDFSAPPLLVITGKNGSGKSHFLEALSSKRTSAITIDKSSTVTRIFKTFGDFYANLDTRFNAADYEMERQEILEEFIKCQTASQELFKGEKINHELIKFHASANHYISEVSAIYKLALQKNLEPLHLNRRQIFELVSETKEYKAQSVFSADLKQIFYQYNQNLISNRFQRYLHHTDPTNQDGLTDIEFLTKYGQPPWMVLNDALSTANLDFGFSAPPTDSFYQDFPINLRKRTEGIQLEPKDLSSGEKALLAFAIAIFRSNHEDSPNKIFLLDEPDAPLHPHFCERMMSMIQETLIVKMKASVVLTTHSPTTVAMCPEDSIFEMDPRERKPVKVKREEAIKRLTSGIKDFQISTDLTRQVFCEGLDAKHFNRVFKYIDERQPLGFSANFINFSHKEARNCEEVKSIVRQLKDCGNEMVRGIIDWDTRNEPSTNVLLLGGKNRYAIENYVLDPIFIGIGMVIRSSERTFLDFGIQKEASILNARNFDAMELQTISDYILHQTGIDKVDLLNCQLENGLTIEMPREFLFMNGHEWADKVLTTFNSHTKLSKKFKRLSQGNENKSVLLKNMIDVIMELPEFLSADLRATFANLK